MRLRAFPAQNQGGGENLVRGVRVCRSTGGDSALSLFHWFPVHCLRPTSDTGVSWPHGSFGVRKFLDSFCYSLSTVRIPRAGFGPELRFDAAGSFLFG